MSNPAEQSGNAGQEVGFRRGTLIRGIGSFYTAMDETGACFTLRCKKKFRRLGLTPLTGDTVLFSPGEGEDHGWIEEILPRRSVCLRPPVANVTLLIVVLSPVPEPDLLLADRLISRAAAQDLRVLLLLNKADLAPAISPQEAEEYRMAGLDVISVSAKTGIGLPELKDAMRGELCCFTGQSGAGKSTLLNALLNLELETGDISRKIARGKNTTRSAELIVRDGLRVMDTAGFSLLEPERDLPPEKLRERWSEFRPYEGRCRFRECLHDREPGCAVQEAADLGRVGASRLARYRILLSEARETWRERYD